MELPIVNHPDYVAQINEDNKFPIQKFGALAEHLLKFGVVKKFHIPKEYPQALIEGFLWDVEDRKYENIHELCDYAARVAGSVGAMISCLMKVGDPSVIARACELGVAMQLTNIARDVGEDAKSGRLYLPREWLREEGIDPEL